MTRLTHIDIERFGAIPPVTFDLPNGLCVVYGPNEAGKSTLLHALDAAIGGVSPRGHLGTPAREVRVAFAIGDSKTGSITRYLRTARGLTLASDPQRISSDVENPWQGTFDALGPWLTTHGLDHQHLRAGGRALIDGRGDLADVVFEALEGFSARATLRDIETRMDELYKRKRGSSAIKEALLALSLAEQRENEAVVDPEVIKHHQALCDQASKDVEEARNVYHSAELRLLACQRHQAAFHDVRTMQDLGAEREALGDFILDDESCQVLADLLESKSAITERITVLTDRCAELDTLVDTSPAADSILDDEETIDALLRRKADADRDREQSETAAVREAEAFTELNRLLVDADPHTLTDDPYAHARSLLLSEDIIAGLSSAAELALQQRSILDAARIQSEEALRTLEDHAAITGTSSAEAVDLHHARRVRDSAWQEVRRVLSQKGPLDDDSVSTCIATYEEGIANFDIAVESALGATQRSAERATLESNVAKLRRAQEREREQLLATEANWRDLSRAAQLPLGIAPEGWAARHSMLSHIKEVCARIDDHRHLVHSTGDIWRTFRTSVEGLGIKYSYTGGVEAILDSLAMRLRVTRESFQLHEQHIVERSENQTSLAAMQKALAECEVQIENIRTRFQIPDSQDLTDTVTRSAHAHELDTRITSIRHQLLLLHHHDDEVLKATIAYAKERTLAELELELQEASADKTVAFSALESALSRLREAERGLHEAQYRDEAPRLAQEVTDLRLTLAEMSEEYARLAIQRHILQLQRQKLTALQGSTTLANAGELLEVFTGGRFIALEAVEQGSDDRTVIVHRADSAEFQLHELSEGTADQVYLSLRLAGLRARTQHMSEAGLLPYPIVLDDVLLAFDDARTHAALAYLREWSGDTQILLTSHHQAVRQAAEDLGIPVICAPTTPEVTPVADVSSYRSHRSVPRATPDASQSRLSRQEALARVREWCARRGDEVPTRRIPKAVLAEYVSEYPHHAEALGL
jgi:uncharacterized protein YhaN